jgi:hypothetical protein
MTIESLRPAFATAEDDIFVRDLVGCAPLPTVEQRDRLARLLLGARGPMSGGAHAA